VYLDRMKGILTSHLSGSMTNRGPTSLLDHVYIGSRADAHKVTLLKSLKITHVLDCAGKTDYSDLNCFEKPDIYKKSGINYKQINADDTYGYPMMRHFTEAKAFIDSARQQGGRCLVHCEMGINRSGCICIAYMMVHENITLLSAIRRAKMSRPTILVNEGFQEQLIRFGDDKDLLYDGGRLSRRLSNSSSALDQLREFRNLKCSIGIDRAKTPS